MADEWVDHDLSMSQEVEKKLVASNRAWPRPRRNTNIHFFCLAEAERGRKSAEASLGRAKRQAEELRVLLKKTDE